MRPLQLLAMRPVWLLVLLLLVPLAGAHHREGHDGGPGIDGGLIQIDLGSDDDRDDKDDDEDKDNDEKDDDKDDDEKDEDEKFADHDSGDRRERDSGQATGPECLQLSANATRSGNAVAWQSGQDTSIYRATGDGEFHLVHEAGPEEVLFMDRDVKKYSSYRYQATTGGAADCPAVGVTAVPFMSGLAGVLAGVAAVAGYALVRRR